MLDLVGGPYLAENLAALAEAAAGACDIRHHGRREGAARPLRAGAGKQGERTSGRCCGPTQLQGEDTRPRASSPRTSSRSSRGTEGRRCNRRCRPAPRCDRRARGARAPGAQQQLREAGPGAVGRRGMDARRSCPSRPSSSGRPRQRRTAAGIKQGRSRASGSTDAVRCYRTIVVREAEPPVRGGAVRRAHIRSGADDERQRRTSGLARTFGEALPLPLGLGIAYILTRSRCEAESAGGLRQ